MAALGSVSRTWVAVSDPALAPVLATTQLRLPGVELVAARAVALGAALLSESAVEVIPRAKHEDYLSHEAQRGRTAADNPSMAPWSHLPESLRTSNLRFAEGIASKLAAMGATLRPLDQGMPDELDLSPDDLEDLARDEHERWRRDLERDGWRVTRGRKGPEGRLHPLLVDWEQLDEVEREKDRDAIRALPRLLARAGYRLSLPGETERV